MAALTGRTKQATYGGLLFIDNSNNGIDGTLRTVEDGKGNDLPLQVSSTHFKITGKIDGSVEIEFETGVNAIIGRGTGNDAITYFALRNANGDLCYVYPSNTGGGIKVSTTRP